MINRPTIQYMYVN